MNRDTQSLGGGGGGDEDSESASTIFFVFFFKLRVYATFLVFILVVLS